jgi:diguanylate cyclase (GGDEF)-like protein/PAS domain S-box-containing protein
VKFYQRPLERLGQVLYVHTQWVIFAIVLLFNTAAALLIAILLVRMPSAPGERALVAMLLLLALWSFGYAMITLVPEMEAKRFWLKFENIGILTVPTVWFIFTVQYARLDRWLNRYTAGLLFLIPAVSLVILFSDSWFHAYYSTLKPVSESVGPLVIGRGSWYVVALVNSYIFNLMGMAVLIWCAIQYRDLYRRQTFALIGAVLVPLLVNLFYQLAPTLLPAFSTRVDLTPISFTMSAALIAFGVFGLRIFDLIPIARYTVLEHIPELVLVVDAHNRVLDANSVAQTILNQRMDELLGKSLSDVFRPWPHLLDRYLKVHEVHEEIQIPGELTRTFELVISGIYNRFNTLEGRVIVAHDITDQKRLQNDLQCANDTLTLQLAEIQELRERLQEQAIRDPLTNVYNRRYMAEFLDQEIARAGRENYLVSVAIMDMDNFKQFNDTYGHKCGDVVLQAFADFLVNHTRRSDVVCRYGGEEFVILMPNASLAAGYTRVEAWRQDFSESAIAYEDMKFSATFSAGVAAFPEHGLSGEEILQAADEALYRSKNGGRNRVSMSARSHS